VASSLNIWMIRVYIGSRSRYGGRPLHKAIVESAREHGMVGATVIRGMLGYGKSGVIHRASLRARFNEFPLVVQIADQPERIAAFLPQLEPMIQNGLVTVQTLLSEQMLTKCKTALQDS